jgi:hypothetical protein
VGRGGVMPKTNKQTNKQTILHVFSLVDTQLLLQDSQSAVDIRSLNLVFYFLKTFLQMT